MAKSWKKDSILQRNSAPIVAAALNMRVAAMFVEVAAIQNAKIADINFERV